MVFVLAELPSVVSLAPVLAKFYDGSFYVVETLLTWERKMNERSGFNSLATILTPVFDGMDVQCLVWRSILITSDNTDMKSSSQLHEEADPSNNYYCKVEGFERDGWAWQ